MLPKLVGFDEIATPCQRGGHFLPLRMLGHCSVRQRTLTSPCFIPEKSSGATGRVRFPPAGSGNHVISILEQDWEWLWPLPEGVGCGGSITSAPHHPGNLGTLRAVTSLCWLTEGTPNTGHCRLFLQPEMQTGLSDPVPLTLLPTQAKGGLWGGGRGSSELSRPREAFQEHRADHAG